MCHRHNTEVTQLIHADKGIGQVEAFRLLQRNTAWTLSSILMVRFKHLALPKWSQDDVVAKCQVICATLGGLRPMQSLEKKDAFPM